MLYWRPPEGHNDPATTYRRRYGYVDAPLHVTPPGRGPSRGSRRCSPSFTMILPGVSAMTQVHHGSETAAPSDHAAAEVVVYFGDDPLRVYQLRQWLPVL